jgi:nucleoid-associated protein YgaU
MDIKLIPVDTGQRFTFPSLPEKITAKYGAKYQSFDIISQGTVKVPKGTDADEFTWNHVFFGPSKKNEPICKKDSYQEPDACVNIIKEYMTNETVLNLIVTDTWINVDVTVSSFEASPVGAFGNVEYSITLTRKKPLQIYSTNELKIAAFVKKTKSRTSSNSSNSSSGTYTVVSGDTLSGIASRKCGGASKWPSLYSANSSVIEAAAKKHGKSSSDHGHWIYPGTTLQLV